MRVNRKAPVPEEREETGAGELLWGSEELKVRLSEFWVEIFPKESRAVTLIQAPTPAVTEAGVETMSE